MLNEYNKQEELEINEIASGLNPLIGSYVK